MIAPITKQDTKGLVETIHAFCDKHGIAVSTFGRLAVNDGKFVRRISGGSWIERETFDRVQDFMHRAERGEVALRGRPRRKKEESNSYTMSELVNQQTSIRTPGSFDLHEQRYRFHMFAATTNVSWVQADIMTDDIMKLPVKPEGIRIFYAPMDSGITLTRVLRALHAKYPDMPIQVVIKGWGLEDLRNTMGRMVDRLSEHPKTVLVLTNLYTREAVHLKKSAQEGPGELVWRDVELRGEYSYDYQQQVAELFGDLAQEWTVFRGEDDFPVYSRPSVVTICREDMRQELGDLVPQENGADLEFDYCFLNHPYLHSHTMKFRVDYILAPVIRHLAPGGQMKVVQSLGEDPAHEIVRRVWPDQPLRCVSRHDIISALRKSMRDELKDMTFSGLTDARSLFRFDMHTMPTLGKDERNRSPQGAWSNAVYFAQIKEELAQEAMAQGSRHMDITADVLREHGGLWFVNETFSITRKMQDE